MTRILDERFLTVHPRTALWWEQRETCKKCVHFRKRADGALSCTAIGGGGGTGLNGGDAACISARDEGQRCGPDAKLFIEGDSCLY